MPMVGVGVHKLLGSSDLTTTMHRPNRRTVLPRHCNHPMLQLNARSMQVWQFVERPETQGKFQLRIETHRSPSLLPAAPWALLRCGKRCRSDVPKQRGRRSDTRYKRAQRRRHLVSGSNLKHSRSDAGWTSPTYCKATTTARPHRLWPSALRMTRLSF